MGAGWPPCTGVEDRSRAGRAGRGWWGGGSCLCQSLTPRIEPEGGGRTWGTSSLPALTMETSWRGQEPTPGQQPRGPSLAEILGPQTAWTMDSPSIERKTPFRVHINCPRTHEGSIIVTDS